MPETQMNRGQNIERGKDERHHEPVAAGPIAGYGACSSSGCNCKGFTGSGDTCANCGHNYATHW